MGNYTEIFVCCRVKEGPAVQVLQFMLEGSSPHPDFNTPEHPLFSTPRWNFMLQCSSYYHVPRSMHRFEWDDIGKYHVLISRSDFKNYDNEVELFFDWLRPHLDADSDDMIGYARYEETREPTIYYGRP